MIPLGGQSQSGNGGLDWWIPEILRSQSGNGGLDREYSTEIMITKW